MFLKVVKAMNIVASICIIFEQERIHFLNLKLIVQSLTFLPKNMIKTSAVVEQLT